MSCSGSSKAYVGGSSSQGSLTLTSSLKYSLSRSNGLVIESISDIRKDPVNERTKNDLLRREGTNGYLH